MSLPFSFPPLVGEFHFPIDFYKFWTRFAEGNIGYKIDYEDEKSNSQKHSNSPKHEEYHMIIPTPISQTMDFLLSMLQHYQQMGIKYQQQKEKNHDKNHHHHGFYGHSQSHQKHSKQSHSLPSNPSASPFVPIRSILSLFSPHSVFASNGNILHSLAYHHRLDLFFLFHTILKNYTDPSQNHENGPIPLDAYHCIMNQQDYGGKTPLDYLFNISSHFNQFSKHHLSPISPHQMNELYRQSSFSMGDSLHDQLGYAADVMRSRHFHEKVPKGKRKYSFKHIKHLKDQNIQHVACSNHMSLFLSIPTSSSASSSASSPTSSVHQCGYFQGGIHIVPTLVSPKNNSNNNNNKTSTSISSPSSWNVIQMVCGEKYAAALTKEGNVYVWGLLEFIEDGEGESERKGYHHATSPSSPYYSPSDSSASLFPPRFCPHPHLVDSLRPPRPHRIISLSASDHRITCLTSNNDILLLGISIENYPKLEMTVGKPIESVRNLMKNYHGTAGGEGNNTINPFAHQGAHRISILQHFTHRLGLVVLLSSGDIYQINRGDKNFHKVKIVIPKSHLMWEWRRRERERERRGKERREQKGRKHRNNDIHNDNDDDADFGDHDEDDDDHQSSHSHSLHLSSPDDSDFTDDISLSSSHRSSLIRVIKLVSSLYSNRVLAITNIGTVAWWKMEEEEKDKESDKSHFDPPHTSPKLRSTPSSSSSSSSHRVATWLSSLDDEYIINGALNSHQTFLLNRRGELLTFGPICFGFPSSPLSIPLHKPLKMNHQYGCQHVVEMACSDIHVIIIKRYFQRMENDSLKKFLPTSPSSSSSVPSLLSLCQMHLMSTVTIENVISAFLFSFHHRLSSLLSFCSYQILLNLSLLWKYSMKYLRPIHFFNIQKFYWNWRNQNVNFSSLSHSHTIFPWNKIHYDYRIGGEEEKKMDNMMEYVKRVADGGGDNKEEREVSLSSGKMPHSAPFNKGDLEGTFDMENETSSLPSSSSSSSSSLFPLLPLRSPSLSSSISPPSSLLPPSSSFPTIDLEYTFLHREYRSLYKKLSSIQILKESPNINIDQQRKVHNEHHFSTRLHSLISRVSLDVKGFDEERKFLANDLMDNIEGDKQRERIRNFQMKQKEWKGQMEREEREKKKEEEGKALSPSLSSRSLSRSSSISSLCSSLSSSPTLSPSLSPNIDKSHNSPSYSLSNDVESVWDPRISSTSHTPFLSFKLIQAEEEKCKEKEEIPSKSIFSFSPSLSPISSSLSPSPQQSILSFAFESSMEKYSHDGIQKPKQSSSTSLPTSSPPVTIPLGWKKDIAASAPSASVSSSSCSLSSPSPSSLPSSIVSSSTPSLTISQIQHEEEEREKEKESQRMKNFSTKKAKSSLSPHQTSSSPSKPHITNPISPSPSHFPSSYPIAPQYFSLADFMDSPAKHCKRGKGKEKENKIIKEENTKENSLSQTNTQNRRHQSNPWGIPISHSLSISPLSSSSSSSSSSLLEGITPSPSPSPFPSSSSSTSTSSFLQLQREDQQRIDLSLPHHSMLLSSSHKKSKSPYSLSNPNNNKVSSLSSSSSSPCSSSSPSSIISYANSTTSIPVSLAWQVTLQPRSNLSDIQSVQLASQLEEENKHTQTHTFHHFNSTGKTNDNKNDCKRKEKGKEMPTNGNGNGNKMEINGEKVMKSNKNPNPQTNHKNHRNQINNSHPQKQKHQNHKGQIQGQGTVPVPVQVSPHPMNPFPSSSPSPLLSSYYYSSPPPSHTRHRNPNSMKTHPHSHAPIHLSDANTTTTFPPPSPPADLSAPRSIFDEIRK